MQPAANATADALKGIIIPPKPQILIDLQNAKSNTNKMIELIEKDPGISASILKTINSPFFGIPHKVTSIQKAVLLLGIDAITNIVNALAMRTALSTKMQVKMEEFWDSSMDVAKAAGAIAGVTKRCARDIAYTLGLFHNCGIPILLQKFPSFNDTIKHGYAADKGNLVDTERKEVGIDHALIGYKLCQLWNMEQHVCDAIRFHHDGEIFADAKITKETKTLIAVLMMAEHIAEVHKILGKAEKDYQWDNVKKPIFDLLNITQEEFEDLKEDVLDKVLSET